MRPWTALKLCERLIKYAGVFEEQPMPLGLMSNSGCTPISYMASMMRSEMALWPQPAHNVVLPPLESMTVRPMRLVLGAGAAAPGSTVVVDIYLPSILPELRFPELSLLGQGSARQVQNKIEVHDSTAPRIFTILI